MRFEQSWEGRPYQPEAVNHHPFFSVEVPGNIQYDYARFLGIENLQFANTVKQLEKTEDFFWEYRTFLSFRVHPGERAVLVAEGVDYQFDILLLIHQYH